MQNIEAYINLKKKNMNPANKNFRSMFVFSARKSSFDWGVVIVGTSTSCAS